MSNWFTRKADEMRQANDKAIQRNRKILEANENARRGEERVFRHLGQLAEVYRGICPQCDCRVDAKVQRQAQEALMACSCGHTVTLRQWQQQN